MNSTDSFPKEAFWQSDSFRSLKSEEFESYGITPSDIPQGTFPALKHPTHLQSRYGGNAYGFGLFEVHDRLRREDIKLLHSLTFDDPEAIKEHHGELNRIYKQIGLLIRFSSLGKPYYLIPEHLVSDTLTYIKSKVDEISKAISFHRTKFYTEHHRIGLVTHQDDLITRELTFLFKEHHFVVIDSIEKLKDLDQTLDLVILTRDLYEIIPMEKFSPFLQGAVSRKTLNQYAMYILWKVYNLLKPNGEILIIANHYAAKTNRTTKVVFKTAQEENNFALFSHVFKTRKKYRIKDHALQVNIFDFQKYVSGLYMEEEVIDTLLSGKSLADMSLEEIGKLPYINAQLAHWNFLTDQEKAWSRLLSTFYDKIRFKPLIPQPVRKEWGQRFSFADDYSPNCMLVYLGQKKALRTTLSDVRREVTESGLIGCPEDLLAGYRNSFGYVITTLSVLMRLKKGHYEGLPQIFVDRLKQPLINKNRRFSALNDMIKLTNRIGLLERVRDYLNPDKIEGTRTEVLENLEALTFFGFSHHELKELVYIVLGHSAWGRIISGKMNEKRLKPVSDLARTYDLERALNLLRYCRLMTMAETEAARRRELTKEQLVELFDLYESCVRIITNRDLDWDTLLDEKISSMGGIHNKIIRKLLKMINHFELLSDVSELVQKGPMEKESLADYDEEKLSRIENAIKLVNTIEQFEEMHLQSDPLQLPAFYRKFIDIEFHGTGHIFERMDSELVFILLWTAVNVTRGEVINFNPILANVETTEIDERIKKVEAEVRAINMQHLNHAVLGQLSEELYHSGSSFIAGTGFQLKVDPETQALGIAYMDMDKSIEKLGSLSEKLAGRPISEIPVEDLMNLEGLFSSLETFFQSHLRLLDQTDQSESTLKLPGRQNRWFERVKHLRGYLRSNFMRLIFHPQDTYTNLDLLYRYAPSLLDSVLPEFTALQDLDVSWHLYMTSPVTHYIITATSKLQALIRRNRESFQDSRYLHKLAQREFGPMATGIVGVNESQIEELEDIVARLSRNRPLFHALVGSLIFQDIGRVPFLREKYGSAINPVDLARTGAFLIEKEELAERYHFDEKGKAFMVFLVKHHSLIHHVLRGEFSFFAIKEVLDSKDRDLFDAFFVLSFIMLSAIRDDLILEDLAARLFQVRDLCYRIINDETTLEEELDELFAQREALFHGLEAYRLEGLPKGVSPGHYLESLDGEEVEKSRGMQVGRMIFAIERLLRLRGIRYVEFFDLVNLIMEVPLRFIYKKKGFSSIGYSTFEKEVYEAFRSYNTFQGLREETRHFILNQLADDRVRIYGYEKVCGYLSYENQIKLLLAALLGAKKFRQESATVCLNFLELCKKIEKRFEAVNAYLNSLTTEKIWGDKAWLNQLFKAKTGLLLIKDAFPNVLTIDFQDRVNISKKTSHMQNIDDVEQLKNYFHYSLRSLRQHPLNTEDYEVELEQVFEKRLTEITDMILNQAKMHMDLMEDFGELHKFVSDLVERSWDIGFSADQKHRLNDLHAFRKDSLMRNKFSEIVSRLSAIHDIQELKDYWDSIKCYLQDNRRYLGKEFEMLVARKFDEGRTAMAA
ncbi:MAG: hypothetical protein GY849_00810 [Deltaproteobacteria bacterium]|nr:hypothetical protein [Deltaproteobacteria bacterium]